MRTACIEGSPARLFRNVRLASPTWKPRSTPPRWRSHHGIDALVNMSQMTVTQMSITETTNSPSTSCTGSPSRHSRGLDFLPSRCGQPSSSRASPDRSPPRRKVLRRARAADRRRQTSPIAAADVTRAVTVILDDPAPHIGQIYNLTGRIDRPDHYARVFSEALGRPIRYRDAPLPAWSEGLRQAVSRARRQPSHGHDRVNKRVVPTA